MAKKTGQRWYDEATQQCRAEYKRKRTNADGTVTVLSRGRFVDCKKQIQGKFQCRHPAGATDKNGKAVSGWAPAWMCEPGGPYAGQVAVNWNVSREEARKMAPKVLTHFAPWKLIGRVQPEVQGPLQPEGQGPLQQILPFEGGGDPTPQAPAAVTSFTVQRAKQQRETNTPPRRGWGRSRDRSLRPKGFQPPPSKRRPFARGRRAASALATAYNLPNIRVVPITSPTNARRAFQQIRGYVARGEMSVARGNRLLAEIKNKYPGVLAQSFRFMSPTARTRGRRNGGQRDPMPALTHWIKGWGSKWSWLSAEGPLFVIKQKGEGWKLKIRDVEMFEVEVGSRPSQGPYATPRDAADAARSYYELIRATSVYKEIERSGGRHGRPN